MKLLLFYLMDAPVTQKEQHACSNSPVAAEQVHAAVL